MRSARPPGPRTSSVLRGAAPLTLLLVLTLAACEFNRRFDVRGRIAGFSDDRRTVFVEHEAIPGFMDAMTMPFRVPDTTALSGLSFGDAIAFEFVVARDSSWIRDVRLLPDSAVAEHPAGAPPSTGTETPVPMLRPGERVPDVTLTAQDSTAFSLRDHPGEVLLMTYIYTRCPVPDYCPRLSRQFQVLQDRLTERFDDRVHLLSITFDPEHDTPAVLRDYAARYTDDLSTWTFATGTPEAIADAAHPFGVYYEPVPGEIVHNFATVLVGPDGRFVEQWRGTEWDPAEVESAVAELLAP